MEEGAGWEVQLRMVGKLARTVALAGESLNSSWPLVAACRAMHDQRGVGLG